MKKALTIIGTTLLALVVVIVAVSAYYGIFNKVEFTTKEVGPYRLVYQEIEGAYSNMWPVVDDIYYTLLDKGVETKQRFGLYFDDPMTTPEEELRSIAGVIVPQSQFDNFVLIQTGVSKEFKVADKFKTQALTTEFPYKNKLSIMYYLIKVYPAMEKYMVANDIETGPVMEIYDMEAGKVYFSVAENGYQYYADVMFE